MSCQKRNGPCAVQRENRFVALRCGCPPRGRGLPSWCRPDSSAFCRLAPGYVFTSALTRVSGAAENRGGHRMVPAPEPAAAPWSREGPFQRADTQVRPYGRTRNRHRLVGADLCVGPCPAREGQRQRLRSRSRLCRLTLDSRSRLRRATDVASPLRVKSAQRVSGASPGRRVPQGPGVSVPGCREGRPTFLRRRQEVRMYADRPAETFFLLTGCDRFLFDLSKRKWGHIGTSRHPG